MRVVSLFAGIGGFDTGFQRAGFDIAAHVEKDANCLKLLKDKWPDAVAVDDVCKAGASNLPHWEDLPKINITQPTAATGKATP